MNVYEVVITKKAKQDLLKIPQHIVKKLLAWVEDVMHSGLQEVRKIPGFYDEPLQGQQVGERSIRLSKSYRAIYKTSAQGVIQIVMILEVNKHDY